METEPQRFAARFSQSNLWSAKSCARAEPAERSKIYVWTNLFSKVMQPFANLWQTCKGPVAAVSTPIISQKAQFLENFAFEPRGKKKQKVTRISMNQI